MKRKNAVSLTCLSAYTLASAASPHRKEFGAKPVLNAGKQTAKDDENIEFAPVRKSCALDNIALV